jgi:hypothetical protein
MCPIDPPAPKPPDGEGIIIEKPKNPKKPKKGKKK